MAKQIDLGAVLPIFKGDWVSGTVYERLNIVRHNSAAWVCNVNVIPDKEVNDAPSNDNSNWVVLAVDTSAVASVNNQTGHVIINTIETPSDDSNPLSIANVEWVRDRVNEAVTSVSSSTATSLAAITEALNNKVSKDGDEMTGELIGVSYAQKLANIDTKTAPSSSQYGNTIRFVDKNGVFFAMLQPVQWSNGGNALRLIVAKKDGSQGGSLTLEEHGDGTTRALTFDGNDVLTSAGGNVDGEFKFNTTEQNGINAILINRDNGYAQMCGGSAWANGAVCTLHGKTYTSKPGWVELRATDGTNNANLVLKPDGSLLKSGNNVATFNTSNRLVFPNGTQFWIA